MFLESILRSPHKSYDFILYPVSRVKAPLPVAVVTKKEPVRITSNVYFLIIQDRILADYFTASWMVQTMFYYNYCHLMSFLSLHHIEIHVLMEMLGVWGLDRCLTPESG